MHIHKKCMSRATFVVLHDISYLLTNFPLQVSVVFGTAIRSSLNRLRNYLNTYIICSKRLVVVGMFMHANKYEKHFPKMLKE